MKEKVKQTKKVLTGLFNTKILNFEKAIEVMDYSPKLLKHIHDNLKKGMSENNILKTIQRLSKEWQFLELLNYQTSNEYHLYEKIIIIIKRTCSEAFKTGLVRTKNILPEFKLPFAQNLAEEKIIIKNMYNTAISAGNKFKMLNYYRVIFSTSEFFPFIIAKEWQNQIDDDKIDDIWIKAYLLFSLNPSLIKQILNYIIQEYPDKFISEIKQLTKREPNEFSTPTTLKNYLNIFIESLLKKKNNRPKVVYQILQTYPEALKEFISGFELCIEIKDFYEMLEIKKDDFIKCENIYFKFESLDDKKFTFGKLIKNLDKDRQLSLIIKNSDAVSIHKDRAVFTIDNFAYNMVNIGDTFSKNNYDNHWMIFVIGEKTKINQDSYLKNVFSGKCITKFTE